MTSPFEGGKEVNTDQQRALPSGVQVIPVATFPFKESFTEKFCSLETQTASKGSNSMPFLMLLEDSFLAYPHNPSALLQILWGGSLSNLQADVPFQ